MNHEACEWVSKDEPFGREDGEVQVFITEVLGEPNWSEPGRVGQTEACETEFHNQPTAFLRNCNCHNPIRRMSRHRPTSTPSRDISVNSSSHNMKNAKKNLIKTKGNLTLTVRSKPSATFRANPKRLHILWKKFVLIVAQISPFRRNRAKKHTDPSQLSALELRDFGGNNRQLKEKGTNQSI